jgi:hypothetical protein
VVLALLSAVVASIPEGLALVVGLAVAAFLVLRSHMPSGVAVAVGVAVLALYLVVSALGYPILNVAVGSLGIEVIQLASAALDLVVALLHGVGVLILLVAACMGPAPARLEGE